MTDRIRLLVIADEAVRPAIRNAIEASDLGASLEETSLERSPSRADAYDCVILAPDKGNTDGALALLRSLRETGDATPVVFVMSRMEDELLQAALDAGANDYLLSGDVSPRRLALRVRFAIRIGNAEAVSASSLAKATQAARTRDEVLAVVSHDLRGPLHAISLASEALAGEVPDDARRYLGAIDRAITRAERLISDLLDANALENGALPITKRPTDAGALVRQACSDHELAVRDSGGSIEARVPPGTITVAADRDRVLQALGNLIGNALKHARGSAIEIAVERGDRDAAFTVRDRGPGISPAELPHVFDRYWRGRTKKGGAGLGLAIAKGIVETHGGTVRVASTPGEGAAFTFTLPLA